MEKNLLYTKQDNPNASFLLQNLSSEEVAKRMDPFFYYG